MIVENYKILLADDDPDDCLFFKEALEELPVTSNLTTVHDGEQLMQYLNLLPSEVPDVLFLDINMPRKNGFACLAEIKQNVDFNKLPIIVISTSYDQGIADSIYKNGAYYYICKPSDFTQLKNVIQKALKLVSQSNQLQPSKENFLISNLK